MEHAGWRVTLPAETLCCGLTRISTGQLATAKRILTRMVRHLAEHVRGGGLVVGLEPSRTAVFRSDTDDPSRTVYGVAPGARPAPPGRLAKSLALAGTGHAAAGAAAGVTSAVAKALRR
ncbi:hypothetical protein [Streptomyces acidicola]|uniref:hypothetical protein n=1 Tax=Streptomyces acidicola TaxID=2596892 RepID=UPI003803FBC3